MNFIVKLLESKELEIKIKYDLIYIMINWLIKRTYFISFNEDMRVINIAYLFHKNITINHDSLIEIIFNKDIRFKSIF